MRGDGHSHVVGHREARIMSTIPPSSLGGDQETSMDDEVTPTTAKPLTELGGEAEKDAHKT